MVRIRACARDERLRVSVEDDGPGVVPSVRKRLFEPFVTSKEIGKGTGLGLAIAASMIENLGGTIWVQHAREGGAAFVMLLPLHTGASGLPIVMSDGPSAAP